VSFNNWKESALAELETARTEDQFLLVKTKYIGRKGLLNRSFKETLLRFPMLKNLYFGKLCNELKNLLNTKN